MAYTVQQTDVLAATGAAANTAPSTFPVEMRVVSDRNIHVRVNGVATVGDFYLAAGRSATFSVGEQETLSVIKAASEVDGSAWVSIVR